ncbi:5-formyltetrahydrofolate cyclo-ligase, mitochondrial-like isoform X2 [Hibiscus syriacus]|uniref:5-formyltetrahydrofolate cyclo-ligase, mitochondrial-like isoform X2 n=1 Tax=Hibiscus syriacus TaxID=106335 RepID=UPI001922F9F6|nr:5-formyltetrahydrofolate cyclo-ligase, mitochondrial-like isoform X2 [Hibiscus syriacus]
MGVIHFYPNSKLQTMFLPRKATHLIRKANVAAHFTPPPTVGFSAANVSRAMVTMNKDGLGVDTHELEPIFQQKQSLRSKVRKALKNMDPIQKSQEDNAIQNTVVESSWFKASKNVCAYISSPALLEVDTSRIISEVLSSPAKERKKLYVPRVVDRNSNMKMLMISSVDDLIEKSMNILEPALVDSDGIQREDVMQASDPLDLFIMPVTMICSLRTTKSSQRRRDGSNPSSLHCHIQFKLLRKEQYQLLPSTFRWMLLFLLLVSFR